MRKEDLCITIPTFFRCPISMEVMKSPVSLSTGVTYDRTSIQKWLDNGNNTCPATMQILSTKDFVPNHTLRRLILLWSTSAAASAAALLRSSPELCLDRLRLLAATLSDSEEKASVFSTVDGLLPALAAVLRRAPPPDLAGEAARVLYLLAKPTQNYTHVRNLLLPEGDDPHFFSSISSLLRRGSPEAKAAALRLLELIAVDGETKLLLAGNNGVLTEILNLVGEDDPFPATVEAGLSLLVSLSAVKKIKEEIFKMGILKKVTVVLCSGNMTVGAVEKALRVVEMACVERGGRGEVCGDERCIEAVLEKSMKVSVTATECGVRILWSLCCLFREGGGKEKVGGNNGVTKLLLLMQSNCSQEVRRMAGDLIKVCSKKNYGSNCCYQTKTAQIMPF